VATTLTGVVWVIVLVVVIAVVALAAVVLWRRSSSDVATPSDAAVAASPLADEAPMSGLEAALAKVTDRDGRPIAERIDAEAQHVDELRVPDDTGPVLRRALDHVERHGSADDASGEPSVGDGD
jgi:hypothetical protein